MDLSCWCAKAAMTCGLFRIAAKEDSARPVHVEKRKNGRGCWNKMYFRWIIGMLS